MVFFCPTIPLVTRRIPTPLIGLGVLLLFGCRDSTGADNLNPADLSTSVVAGDSQKGVAGSVLGDSIVVVVVDSRGKPVPGLSLEWQTPSAEGAVEAPRTVTDIAGRSTNVWELGSATGSQQLIVSVVLGSKSTPLATIHAKSYPRATSVRIEPAGHAFEVGETFRFKATALNEAGTAIPEYPIKWVSTKPAAASVDQEGNVTALQASDAFFISADALGTRSGVTVPVYDYTVRIAPDSLYLTGARAYITAWVSDVLKRDVSTAPRDVFALDSTIIQVQNCQCGGSSAAATRSVTPLRSGETLLIARTKMAADTIRVRVVLP